MSLLRPVTCRLCRRSLAWPRRSFATAAPQASAGGNRVKLVEVGPRDGLQNEKTTIPVATKMQLIQQLAKTGLSTIEAGSFVSPKWVPQMEHSAEVMQQLLQQPMQTPVPITYSFLTPNTKGLLHATNVLKQNPGSFATQAEPATGKEKPSVEIAVFTAPTESFSQKNLNCDIRTSLDHFKEVIQEAKALGLRVRAYVSVVLGCPYEGFDVDPHRVAEVATDLLESGADEISLGDTTGMGTAPRTSALLKCMTAAGIRTEDLVMHLHDTYGQALVNTAVALEHGVRTFDSSVAGLGGCPFSPGASGNVATEDVVYFMETLGMHTGVDLDVVADVGAWIAGELGKPNESCVGKTVLGARVRRAEAEAKMKA